MKHDELYSADWYLAHEPGSVMHAPVMAASIVRDLTPKTAIDVGCGTGCLLESLQKFGITVLGIELSVAAVAMCRAKELPVLQYDLESDSDAFPMYLVDVAISLEVAEHLSAEFANRFVADLASLSNVIVFSAAKPGQGGLDHVNEQPQEYWIEKFAAKGFTHDSELSNAWHEEWKRQGIAWWYYANLMVFRKIPPT